MTEWRKDDCGVGCGIHTTCLQYVKKPIRKVVGYFLSDAICLEPNILKFNSQDIRSKIELDLELENRSKISLCTIEDKMFQRRSFGFSLSCSVNYCDNSRLLITYIWQSDFVILSF